MAKKHLTEKEEGIMHLFWNHGPMFVRQLLELMPEPRPHFNTVSTFVRILEQNGFLSHEAIGNSHRYYPLLTEEEYSRTALSNVIARYFNNSVRGVISTLVREESLTDEELMDLIKQVKHGQSHTKS